jgi:5-methylcytosine-specific restriction endonuclease McrA
MPFSTLKRSPWKKKLSSDRTRRVRQLRGEISGPPKEGSRRWYEKRLESLNAKYVKMRDGYECVQCRTDGARTDTILDAGHIYPKGDFPGGKFLTENLVAQCRTHNLRHINHPEILMSWYQRERGEDALIALHEKVLEMPRKMSIEWMVEQIAEREKQLAELEVHLAAMV